MNAIAEFPSIDAAEFRPEKLGAPSPSRALTLNDTAIAPLEAMRTTLATLGTKYDRVAFDLKTPAGLAAAKAARHDLRENGRFAVQRATEAFKKQANEAKRNVEGLAVELVALVQPAEDRLDADIKAREAEIEAERIEKARIEAERVAKHRAAIDTIKAYLKHAQQPGMTSERIARGMSALGSMPKIGAETFEEFADEAAAAYTETFNAMHALHERVLGDELRAAEVERQRIENERVARENAERQAELDRQAAALAQQQQEIEAARQRADAAGRSADQGKADTPAPGQREAAPIMPNAEENGSSAGTPAPCASSGAESAEAPPSGDEGPAAHADTSAAGSTLEQEMQSGGQWSPETIERAAGAAPAIINTIPAYTPPGTHSAPAAPRTDTEAAAAIDDALAIVEADDALLRQALALVDHTNKAFLTRFPSHPKPDPAWWAELREMVNALQPALLLRLAEKRQ
jgi:hypothetical protein